MTREFQLHVDPSLYNFKFTGANYITVRYHTEKVGKSIYVEVFELGIGPIMYGAIADKEKVIRDAESAARQNAETYWNDQPAEFMTSIIKGFAPFIK